MAVEIREWVRDTTVLTNADGDIVLHAHPVEYSACEMCGMCAAGVPVCASMRRVVTDEKHSQVYADGVLFAEYDLD
jgi:predicted molibdopterin-dependent oxidoreductase YjgC